MTDELQALTADQYVGHIDGIAEARGVLRIAHQALSDASSGYIATLSDEDRSIYDPKGAEVWGSINGAVHHVVNAEQRLQEWARVVESRKP